METLEAFSNLADVYAKYGYKLYLVGGSVRDYLLKVSSSDLDLCTDATPEQTREFFPDANYRFSKFGTVSFHYDIYKIEVTTLRTEDDYIDYRHPREIKFVTRIEDDYRRRDFTINALYLDRHMKVYDFAEGLKDLKNHVIRMIGDPTKRIEEDPLRILRALRFKLKLNFTLENCLESAIKNNIHLLNNLNQDKINFEIKKMIKIDEEQALSVLDEYQIKH